MSHVTYHMSCVTCDLSHVTCFLLLFVFLIKNICPSEKNGQTFGASWLRVCYQRGLLNLVFFFSFSFLNQKPHIFLSFSAWANSSKNKKGKSWKSPSLLKKRVLFCKCAYKTSLFFYSSIYLVFSLLGLILSVLKRLSLKADDSAPKMCKNWPPFSQKSIRENSWRQGNKSS